MAELSIKEFLNVHSRSLGLRLVAGENGVSRTINSADINRPGLALTGFVELFTFDQVQLLGNHELEYLRSLPRPIRRAALDVIYQFPMPCVVVTGSGRLLPELLQMANLHGIPMLRSEFNTAKFTHLMHFYLDEYFAPQATVHGTLVDVDGVGLLFTGRSGIGKSELGLDLVERGHRLVADDTVVISRMSQGILVGSSPAVLENHMEIRGIGIVDVRRLFGIRGPRRQKRIEAVVDLVDWDDNLEFERIGLEDKATTILGIEIPEITVPLFPGKNITVIVETIALNYLLRVSGSHPAREFNRRLIHKMQEK